MGKIHESMAFITLLRFCRFPADNMGFLANVVDEFSYTRDR